MSFESDLNRSVMRLIVLKLVSVRPMYGYELIQVVTERTRNTIQCRQGTVYPCLHRMENARLISGKVRKTKTGREGRFYSVTAKGRRLLRTMLTEWSRFSAAASKLLVG